MMRILLFPALVVLGLACASSPPMVTKHLLRSNAGELAISGGGEPKPHLVLAKVKVAPYLATTTGIVIETAPGSVRAAHRDIWAEPLQAGVRSYLRGAISGELGYEVGAMREPGRPIDYVIDVYVDQLHGTMDGTALIEAAYRIYSPEAHESGVGGRLSKTAELKKEGYAGVVDAEKRLLDLLGQSISAAVGELESGR